MKKKLRVGALLIAGLLVLLTAALLIFPGFMVKAAVNNAGPLALGVDVRLEKATFRLLKGDMKLNGLFVGNPEGFNTKSLCEVGVISVDLEPGSLISDTIIINKIYIEKPVFTYQKSLLESNLSALLKNLQGEDGGENETKTVKKAGKKLIIRKLIIKDPMVKLSIKGIPAGAPIPLPDIELTDIGKESDVASVTEVLEKVFSAVLSLTTQAVTASINFVEKGGAAAVGVVQDAGGMIKDAGEGILNKAKDLTGLGEKDK